MSTSVGDVVVTGLGATTPLGSDVADGRAHDGFLLGRAAGGPGAGVDGRPPFRGPRRACEAWGEGWSFYLFFWM